MLASKIRWKRYGSAFELLVRFTTFKWLGSPKRLLLDRNGQRVPLIRNYPVQYALAATLFVLAGLVTLGFGNVFGLGLIAFGLGGYLFAAAYYRFF